MPQLIQAHTGAHHWLGAYGPLLALYWLDEIEPSVCRAMPHVLRTFCTKHGSRQIAVVSVSLKNNRPPSGEAREALATLAKNTDFCVQRVAVVRDGDGFIPSIVSSVVAAVCMLGRPNSLHKPFRKIDDAVPWATANLGEFASGALSHAGAIEALNRQLEALRLRYRAAS